jgi:hypothetical protein
MGRRAESLESQRQGLALLEELILAGVSCQAVFFRKAARAAAYWAEVDPAEAIPLLDRAVGVMEAAIAEADGSEALLIEVARVWKRVEPASALFGAPAAGRAVFERLSGLVRKCAGMALEGSPST